MYLVVKNTIIRFIGKKIKQQFSAIFCLVHTEEPVENLRLRPSLVKICSLYEIIHICTAVVDESEG